MAEPRVREGDHHHHHDVVHDASGAARLGLDPVRASDAPRQPHGEGDPDRAAVGRQRRREAGLLVRDGVAQGGGSSEQLDRERADGRHRAERVLRRRLPDLHASLPDRRRRGGRRGGPSGGGPNAARRPGQRDAVAQARGVPGGEGRRDQAGGRGGGVLPLGDGRGDRRDEGRSEVQGAAGRARRAAPRPRGSLARAQARRTPRRRGGRAEDGQGHQGGRRVRRALVGGRALRHGGPRDPDDHPRLRRVSPPGPPAPRPGHLLLRRQGRALERDEDSGGEKGGGGALRPAYVWRGGRPGALRGRGLRGGRLARRPVHPRGVHVLSRPILHHTDQVVQLLRSAILLALCQHRERLGVEGLHGRGHPVRREGGRGGRRGAPNHHVMRRKAFFSFVLRL
mmetsp:Transcript_8937/g.25495  ORF Transcript_8937/g.25495 Transcript_8937/m.25495 type:complete len:396 (-) Transcript_8937:27-1214(-)